MLISPRMLCAGLVSLALALSAACGGSADKASNEPLDPQLLVSNPSAALGASADRFEASVQSVEARFSLEMSMQGSRFGAEGEFAYRAPDSAHMTMRMSGGDGQFVDLAQLGEFEVLLLGDEIYMNTGFTGWAKASLGDLGADADSLKKLLDGHSPLDYQAFVDDVGATVENMGDTTVNGKTYTRLRITTDFGQLMDSVFNSLGGSGLGEGALPMDISGPITMDILMDPATMLPFTFEANGEFNISGESADFKMAFKFFDYNGPVDIPEPPADAVPFDQVESGG